MNAGELLERKMNLMQGWAKNRCVPDCKVRRRRRVALFWFVQVDAAASVGDDGDERRWRSSTLSRSSYGRRKEEEEEKATGSKERGAPGLIYKPGYRNVPRENQGDKIILMEETPRFPEGESRNDSV